MMKILTIIGARPQIIKAAAISRAIDNSFSDKIEEIIVHTGQHYDENMSANFIEELGIPEPNYNLAVGSGSHGEQTARMLSGIEEIVLSEKPDAVLVYGDTNSTVAGGLAAAKLHIPLVHIEAGLRSYNKQMPEEVNRVLCDHMSTLLFSPTEQGLKNLAKEGFSIDNDPPYSADNPKVFHCGDIMYDNSLYFSERTGNEVRTEIGLSDKYILATMHRPSNTDSVDNLTSIFDAFCEISQRAGMPVVIPLHPRTDAKIKELMPASFKEEVAGSGVVFAQPASFIGMIELEKNAELIITDSGGVQKESFFFEKPCIILREQTEWVEIVENGNALICGADKAKIIAAYEQLSKETNLTYPSLYGDGKAAEYICAQLLAQIK